MSNELVSVVIIILLLFC